MKRKLLRRKLQTRRYLVKGDKAMARTRRTIPLDEKIEKAQEMVFQIKDKYDAAVEELNKLIKKKQELQR